MTKTKSEEAIDKLISQAADAGDANDAMKFSQAALNVANATMARNETRGADLNPDRRSEPDHTRGTALADRLD